ncbi:MAG TPA: adenylate/guanylate cyclase domain-containing protein [Candidatus Limnocylindrales bacterium]|nr:adenylate/guanylate cyclase domain-containing protein [Candidatus Limnocylindrales bacterium]
MPKLQVRSFDRPDDRRTFPKGHAALVAVGDATVAIAHWEVGWRWSTHLAPIVGTASCQVHHLGYTLSGTLHVVADDGQSIDITPGTIYEIPAGHDAWVVGDEPWVTLEWTSARIVGVGPEGSGERTLATVLFTDIVDSTATLARVGDERWRQLLSAHNTALRDRLNQFRGREVHTTGDGFLAVFDTPTRAVRCGLAMVNAARGVGVEIRVGVHTGELELVGEDVRGVAVHAAARVLSQGGAGEVLVSATTRALLEGSGLEFEDAGTHELKGLPGSWPLSRVVSSQA